MVEIRHGFYLTHDILEDGRHLTILSDGTPQLGHSPVTVLTMETGLKTRQARKAWFRRMKIERPWEPRN